MNRMQVFKECRVSWRWMTSMTLGLFVVVTLPFVSGCGERTEAVTPLSAFLRVHWVGAAALKGDTNAATLMRVGRLPETAALRRQILERLARWPWVDRGVDLDLEASSLLTPVLNDLVSHEWGFAMADSKVGLPGWLLAIRLESARSGQWESSLSRVVESLNGTSVDPYEDGRAGWVSEDPQTSGLYAFCRSGDWTLVGYVSQVDAFDPFAGELLQFIEQSDAETEPIWLRGNLDFSRMLKPLDLTIVEADELPVVEFTVRARGDGQRIVTDAVLTYPRPLDLDLAPWKTPTNLIHGSQTSLTAVRGLQDLPGLSGVWERLYAEPAPDQLFMWALRGDPVYTYLAATTSDAEETVENVAREVIQREEGWFARTDGGFKRIENRLGVEWDGAPFVWPFLSTFETNGQEYVLGGTFSFNWIVQPMTPQALEQVMGDPQRVCFDWEHTGERLEQLLYLTQFARMVTQHAQLPFETGSVPWLQALYAELGQSVTRVTVSGPNQLAFSRSSTLGLTAAELHLIADWFESPTFPVGLHTFVASPASPGAETREAEPSAEQAE